MFHYVSLFSSQKCVTTFQYLILKWTWPLLFKSFHSQKITGQLEWLKKKKAKQKQKYRELSWTKTVCRRSLSFAAHHFPPPLFWSVSNSLRTASFHSPVVRFLHLVRATHKYAARCAGLQGRSFFIPYRFVLHPWQPTCAIPTPCGTGVKKSSNLARYESAVRISWESVWGGLVNYRKIVCDRHIKGFSFSKEALIWGTIWKSLCRTGKGYWSLSK